MIFLNMGLSLIVLGLNLFQLGDDFFFRDQAFLVQKLGTNGCTQRMDLGRSLGPEIWNELILRIFLLR